MSEPFNPDLPIEANMDEVEDTLAPWEVLVPPGWYHCRVLTVAVKAKNGEPYWQVNWEHVGQPVFQVTDWFGFTKERLNRLKILYKALNLPHKGMVKFHPMDLRDRNVMVQVFQDLNRQGNRQMRVTFRGYQDPEKLKETMQDQVSQPIAEDKDIPF